MRKSKEQSKTQLPQNQERSDVQNESNQPDVKCAFHNDFASAYSQFKQKNTIAAAEQFSMKSPLVLAACLVGGMLIAAAGAVSFVLAPPAATLTAHFAFIGFIAMMAFGGMLTVASLGICMQTPNLCCFAGRHKKKHKNNGGAELNKNQ